ncbi:hypothetical protein HDU82_008830, partial [Entophlyctis luteolus]
MPRIKVTPRMAEFSDPFVPMEELASFYTIEGLSAPEDRPYTWSNSMITLDGFMNFNGTPKVGTDDGMANSQPKKTAPKPKDITEHGSVENDICLKNHPEAGKFAIADYRLLNAGWTFADASLTSGPCLRVDSTLVNSPVYEEMLEYRKTVLKKPQLPAQIVITTNARSLNFGDHSMFNQPHNAVVIISNGDDCKAARETFEESRTALSLSRLWQPEDRELQVGTVRFISFCQTGEVDLRDALKWIRQVLDVEFLEIDVGGTTIRKMIDMGLVDELRMTQAGQIVRAMGRNIEIPLHNQDEVLIIDTDDLGLDAAENDTILTILTNERVPFFLYLEFAKEFHRLGISDYVEKALQMGAEREKLMSTKLYYIERASMLQRTEQASRTSLLSKATEIFNRAESIDSRGVWTTVVRGSLNLAASKNPDAIKAFMHALNEDSANAAALVGLGSAQLRTNDYKGALKTYQKILSLYPTMQPDPRLAIGVCYHRLQMADEASAAFTRAVEIDPRNSDALALLARVEWNQARADGNAELLEQAIERVKAAFESNKKNSSVLNLVGEGMYFKGLYQKAELVAKAAIANTDSASLKAEAQGILAKSFHAQGKFAEASEMYSKATDVGPSSIPYIFGLGQMHIQNGEHQKALDCFEKILAKDPENLEALKALIRKFNGEDTKADEENAVIFPDPVMQMELAKIYEGINLKTALKGYLNALSILETQDSTASAIEVLNNIGALYHRDAQTTDDYELAKSYYLRALAAIDASKNAQPEKADLKITVRYNMARLD